MIKNKLPMIGQIMCTLFLFTVAFPTLLSYAASTSPNNTMGIEGAVVPSAESVHISESMKVPSSVGTFVILIANEAHESWSDEKHKLITDKNAYYIPTNLTIPNRTALVFLNADAPWDTPHPHMTEIQDSSGI